MVIFSGGMLIAAGVTVWSLRKSYRKELPSANTANKDEKDPGLIHIV